MARPLQDVQKSAEPAGRCATVAFISRASGPTGQESLCKREPCKKKYLLPNRKAGVTALAVDDLNEFIPATIRLNGINSFYALAQHGTAQHNMTRHDMK